MIFLFPLFLSGFFLGDPQVDLRVAYFSKDPPSIEPLSPTFDPDSYAVITQIFDSLVYFDLDGHIQPGLATHWSQINATTWEFTLRPGVFFHNGEPFDSRAVKFTYDFVINPQNRCGNAWILSSIDHVETLADDPLKVRIFTKYPDGMFLNRLNMFGSICPPQHTQEHWASDWAKRPIGTGPFKLDRWVPGQSIRLVANPNYWDPTLPKVPAVRFVILPENQWVAGLLNGDLDFIPNLSGNDTTRVMRSLRQENTIIKRLVLSGYWVMLRNQGPLADVRVRQALNYGLDKGALRRLGDGGNSEPLASLGKKLEIGANPNLKPYPYDPEKARMLLQEVGIKHLKLKAISADIAGPIALIMKGQYERLGIDMELEIVSRSEWADRIVGTKIRTGQAADYDMAINLVDNPIYDLAFHAGLFLDSKSPWSLLNSPEFDRLYQEALHQSEPAKHIQKLQLLDQYIQENALMVFTTQRIITAAHNSRVSIPKFGLNGHLDYLILSTAEIRHQP
ncbi:MAG: ABC transporter substrate-binding protein [Acidobacteria bacterium]|nr:ABC transporter substrate-binding protein [Acidobacteriota bacterium]